jgi:hypothetical protein
MFHFHIWSKWSPPFQRYDLTWRTSRRCRTCGEERIKPI